MTLFEACREVMLDKSVTSKYRDVGGLQARDILAEIRIKHGADAFPLVSIIDICDEMRELYDRYL